MFSRKSDVSSIVSDAVASGISPENIIVARVDDLEGLAAAKAKVLQASGKGFAESAAFISELFGKAIADGDVSDENTAALLGACVVTSDNLARTCKHLADIMTSQRITRFRNAGGKEPTNAKEKEILSNYLFPNVKEATWDVDVAVRASQSFADTPPTAEAASSFN